MKARIQAIDSCFRVILAHLIAGLVVFVTVFAPGIDAFGALATRSFAVPGFALHERESRHEHSIGRNVLLGRGGGTGPMRSSFV